MSLEKVENSIGANRQLIAAIVNDLEKMFGYKGYTPTSKQEEIMYKEGAVSVVDYLKRKYL